MNRLDRSYSINPHRQPAQSSKWLWSIGRRDISVFIKNTVDPAVAFVMTVDANARIAIPAITRAPPEISGIQLLLIEKRSKYFREKISSDPPSPLY